MDRIIKFEDLERKYRSRGKQIEVMTEENEKLKEVLNDILAKYESMNKKLKEKDTQIQDIKRDKENLRQWISNMENSFGWEITKTIRFVID